MDKNIEIEGLVFKSAFNCPHYYVNKNGDEVLHIALAKLVGRKIKISIEVLNDDKSN